MGYGYATGVVGGQPPPSSRALNASECDNSGEMGAELVWVAIVSVGSPCGVLLEEVQADWQMTLPRTLTVQARVANRSPLSVAHLRLGIAAAEREEDLQRSGLWSRGLKDVIAVKTSVPIHVPQNNVGKLVTRTELPRAKTSFPVRVVLLDYRLEGEVSVPEVLDHAVRACLGPPDRRAAAAALGLFPTDINATSTCNAASARGLMSRGPPAEASPRAAVKWWVLFLGWAEVCGFDDVLQGLPALEHLDESLQVLMVAQQTGSAWRHPIAHLVPSNAKRMADLVHEPQKPNMGGRPMPHYRGALSWWAWIVLAGLTLVGASYWTWRYARKKT